MATPSVTRGCQRLARSGHASCARVFLQVVSRRCFHSTPPPVLDFLLPAIPSKALRVGLAKKPVSSNQLSITRRFTSSSIRRHTRAILNPKKDDDGKDMNVEITPRASNVRSNILRMEPTTYKSASVSKKLCPKTQTPISPFGSKSKVEVAMDSNISCPSQLCRPSIQHRIL
jgi:hypothetical protein